MKTSTRRTFLITSASAAAASAINLPARLLAADVPPPHVPSYLKGYEQAYRADPRAAARQWFRDA